MKRSLGIVLHWLLFGLTPCLARPVVSGDLLPNPSFEEAGEAGPLGWRTARWGGEATFEHAALGRTGERSVKIGSTSGADVSWQATVPVRIFSTYRLSAWIKTEGVETAGGARGALLNIHNLQPSATEAVTGTVRPYTLLPRQVRQLVLGDLDIGQHQAATGGRGTHTGPASVALEGPGTAETASPGTGPRAGRRDGFR